MLGILCKWPKVCFCAPSKSTSCDMLKTFPSLCDFSISLCHFLLYERLRISLQIFRMCEYQQQLLASIFNNTHPCCNFSSKLLKMSTEHHFTIKVLLFLCLAFYAKGKPVDDPGKIRVSEISMFDKKNRYSYKLVNQ